MKTKSTAWAMLIVLFCIGKTGAAGEAQVLLGSEKNPVLVPHLAEKITVDGDPAKWANIKALPAPYMKKDAGMVKLAWNEEGLFGCVQVKTDKINVDAAEPWTADALEIWLETDAARADSMSDNACQIAFTPNPAAGNGPCTVVMPHGSINLAALKAMWKKTADGYVIEFCIPAKELKAAKMADGTKLGFHYAVDKDGKAIEQFFCEKDTDQGYATPSAWGVIQLGK